MHSANYREQRLLGAIFRRYGGDYAVVYRAFADQSVTKDGALLTLPVESCVRLLVLLKIPRRSVPNDDVTAALHVQSVLNRGRLAQKEADFAIVPLA